MTGLGRWPPAPPAFPGSIALTRKRRMALGCCKPPEPANGKKPRPAGRQPQSFRRPGPAKGMLLGERDEAQAREGDMAEMTPRERVWAALNHREPDRVPLDIGGGGSSTLVVEAYQRLMSHSGQPLREPRIMQQGVPPRPPGRRRPRAPGLRHPPAPRGGRLSGADPHRRSRHLRGCLGRHLAQGRVPRRLLLGAPPAPPRRGDHRGPRSLPLARSGGPRPHREPPG